MKRTTFQIFILKFNFFLKKKKQWQSWNRPVAQRMGEQWWTLRRACWMDVGFDRRRDTTASCHRRSWQWRRRVF